MRERTGVRRVVPRLHLVSNGLRPDALRRPAHCAEAAGDRQSEPRHPVPRHGGRGGHRCHAAVPAPETGGSATHRRSGRLAERAPLPRVGEAARD